MKQYTFCRLYHSELEAVNKLFLRVAEFSDTITPQQFNELLDLGKIQLWTEPDIDAPIAVMVTELHEGVLGKYVTILAFAGVNVDDERKMFASIKRWAQKNGCLKIRAICKDAQARLFARDGFVKVANVVELEIDDEI